MALHRIKSRQSPKSQDRNNRKITHADIIFFGEEMTVTDTHQLCNSGNCKSHASQTNHRYVVYFTHIIFYKRPVPQDIVVL